MKYSGQKNPQKYFYNEAYRQFTEKQFSWYFAICIFEEYQQNTLPFEVKPYVLENESIKCLVWDLLRCKSMKLCYSAQVQYFHIHSSCRKDREGKWQCFILLQVSSWLAQKKFFYIGGNNNFLRMFQNFSLSLNWCYIESKLVPSEDTETK